MAARKHGRSCTMSTCPVPPVATAGPGHGASQLPYFALYLIWNRQGYSDEFLFEALRVAPKPHLDVLVEKVKPNSPSDSAKWVCNCRMSGIHQAPHKPNQSPI